MNVVTTYMVITVNTVKSYVQKPHTTLVMDVSPYWAKTGITALVLLCIRLLRELLLLFRFSYYLISCINLIVFRDHR